MPYNQDEIVAAVLSFYEFLTTLHLPEDCLKRVPGGEWPQITPERFAALEKTDTVIDLLRHLPYIAQDGQKDSEDYQIWELTVCVDYTGAKFEDSFFSCPNRDAAESTQFMSEEIWDRFKDPQHIACLARSSAATAGYHIFVDTRDGQWLVMEYVDGVNVTYDSASEFWEDQKMAFESLTRSRLDRLKSSLPIESQHIQSDSSDSKRCTGNTIGLRRTFEKKSAWLRWRSCGSRCGSRYD
jgi:hypothetical protein